MEIRKNKGVSLLLLGVFLFLVVACGTKSPPTNP